MQQGAKPMSAKQANTTAVVSKSATSKSLVIVPKSKTAATLKNLNTGKTLPLAQQAQKSNLTISPNVTKNVNFGLQQPSIPKSTALKNVSKSALTKKQLTGVTLSKVSPSQSTGKAITKKALSDKEPAIIRERDRVHARAELCGYQQ